MHRIRQYTWLITLLALAVLLAARSLRKDLGSRRQVVEEAAPILQAGAGNAHAEEAETPVAKAAPLSRPLRPSPWSSTGGDGAPTLRGTPTLGGTVRSIAEGAAIADHLLTFTGDGDPIEVRTDNEGRFEFVAPGDGRYIIGGTSDGAPVAGDPPHGVVFWARGGGEVADVVLYTVQGPSPDAQATDRDAGVDVDDDGRHGDGDGEQGPRGNLAGRVVLPGGEAVGAFELIVRRLVSGLEAEAVAHLTVLGGGGDFDVEALPEGDYIVQAFARDHAPAQAHASVPRPLAAAGLRLTLTPGGHIEGVAKREVDDAPLPDAQVTLDARYDLGMYPPRVRYRTTTDAAGRFTLPGIGAARASLQVTAGGHIPQVRPQLRLTAGQMTRVELSLRALPAAAGETQAP